MQIANDGSVDKWRCATYYRGANGTRNPFMPTDAYEDFEDRIAIIAGEAEISPNRAKEILNETTFYPGCGHFYVSCVCGRACDVACYCHLKEKACLHGNSFPNSASASLGNLTLKILRINKFFGTVRFLNKIGDKVPSFSI